MKTVAIIQARMGSTRLPGKTMADLAGRPVLERVVNRTRRATLLDAVCVATTQRHEDDVVASLATELGVAVFRGSEADVLSRYVGAAKATGADTCVRVTADCPLIDPTIIDLVIQSFRDAQGGADYASNRLRATYPRGLDTEVFSSWALREADREAVEPFDRTHVTTFLYRTPGRFRLVGVENEENLSAWRWTLDEPDDLCFVREVYDALGPRDDFGAEDVKRLLLERPELAIINFHVRQKIIEEG